MLLIFFSFSFYDLLCQQLFSVSEWVYVCVSECESIELLPIRLCTPMIGCSNCVIQFSFILF